MMGKSRKWGAALLILCMLFGMIYITGIPVEAAEGTGMTIVFTHDLHSHLDSFMADVDGKETEAGGFARLKTFIDETKQTDENTLVLDGGDFSMGTLYQTLFETKASELRMLGYLGVDATTMGNHEFDYRTKGLTNMLNSAADSDEDLPAFVLCNVDWEASLAGGSKEVAELQKAFENYGISPYVIIEKGGMKVAVTGVFGIDALACAPTCELVFRDPVEAVKETVDEIREKEDADMIVCVSHSGTWEEEDKSEDEILAKKVPELDLIISGHTHSTLDSPIIHGNTAVVSTGEYGIRAGRINLVQNEEGRWDVGEYKLTAMNEEIKEDADTIKKIDALGADIDSAYLSQFGYQKNQVLVHNPWKNPSLKEMEGELAEQPFPNLLADSYLYTVNQIEGSSEAPADVAVVPSGVIRDVFAKDRDITVSDVFNVFSLGIGPDGVPGYPLVSIYLTGEELRTMAEVDASISPMMTTAQLYTAGLTYTFNPNRIILNKVTSVSLCDKDGNTGEIDDDKLYRVIADLYSGQMLGAVSDQSFGILSVVPKDAKGNPVENLEDYIVKDNGQEVKAWLAVARYMESLGGKNGSKSVPEYYNATHDRKILEDDGSIGAILKKPNKIALAMAGIAAAAVVVLILLVILIVKLVKRRRRKRQNR